MIKNRSSLAVKGSRTVRQVVYEKLYEAIVTGRLMPGQRLYEQELAIEMGVSRTPVREALRELERAKLVKSIAHRGVIVNYLTLEEAIEVYEVRSQLEALVFRKAAHNATEAELDEIEKSITDLELTIDKGTPVEILKVADDFHRLVAAASKHKIAIEMLNSLSSYISLLRAELVPLRNRPEDTLIEHRAIFAALKARDADAAARAAVEHIEKIKEAFVANMKALNKRNDP
ncbi:MAG: GntR family transcriptional regulator [Clostridia bacterium]|nr:GntR family transcriptional regulator [Clostridia bacterium]